MAITPYRTSDPFERLWDSLLGSSAGGYPSGGGLIRAPATDVVENEREIRVIAELPGINAEDVDIDLENNVLTIRGEKREERNETDEQGTFHLAERRYGQFSRSFILPRDVDSDAIEANFENGVLTVRIPKSEKARRRRIEIGGGGGGGHEVSVQEAGEEKKSGRGTNRKKQEG
jgi:HSP20 family protein